MNFADASSETEIVWEKMEQIIISYFQKFN